MAERRVNFWDEDEWRKIIVRWPSAVQRGFAKRLRVIQLGGQPTSHAKPLSGFEVPIWELWHRSGQRVVYCVHYASISGCVEVLDAFEKDSGEGRTMRTSDKERIARRVAALKREMEELQKRQRAAQRMH